MAGKELMDGSRLADMFVAGARDAFVRRGFGGKEADALVDYTCKQAASRKVPLDRYDDEEDTWWSRNKSWLIPSLVGILAFKAGGAAEKYGRPDEGGPRNALNLLFKKINTASGRVFGERWSSLTEAR